MSENLESFDAMLAAWNEKGPSLVCGHFEKALVLLFVSWVLQSMSQTLTGSRPVCMT